MKSAHYISIVLLGLAHPIIAQEVQLLENKTIVRQQEIRQKGDSLDISFLLDINQLELPSTRSLTLTPVLSNGETSHALTPILLNGSNRHKTYHRNVALGTAYPDEYYTVQKVTQKNLQPIDYQESVLCEPWMKNANLYLVEDYCGCAGYTAQSNREKLNVSPLFLPVKSYEAQFAYCYAEPQKEVQKNRTALEDIFLNFPVNKMVIYPDYMNNQAELDKAQEMIEKINSDHNLSIQKITLRGYASPEGSVPSNCRLSEGRAAALKNYLTPRLHNNQLPMFSESGCEDWKGTIELLERSDIDGRDLLLDAIRKCDHSDAAEIGLRTLAGGIPYTAMLHEIYPKVRRVVCSVDYTVREFTIEEGRRIINEHPELLSMYEMHQIAFSYPGNSPEFLDAFRTAERIYPQNEIALLNGAIVALADSDTEKAAANLQKVTMHNPICLNAQGILLACQGKKEEAKECFLEAMEEGLDVAKHNLSELEKTMK